MLSTAQTHSGASTRATKPIRSPGTNTVPSARPVVLRIIQFPHVSVSRNCKILWFFLCAWPVLLVLYLPPETLGLKAGPGFHRDER